MSAVEIGEPGTAAVHATVHVPRARATSRAGEVRQELAGQAFESALDVAVCDGEHLLGLVSIERLLAASADTQLSEIMDDTAPTVGPDVDQEAASAQLVRARGRSLALVDEQGHFQGLIPPERMLAVLWEEHEQDLARVGGFLAGSSQARAAAEEPIGRRLWHRLPWLGLGLAGAMASAGIVASFEDQLRAEVLLAFFVPAIVYMADAIGTQTETLVIRGISVGVPIRSIFVRELVTGMVIGALISAAFFAFALVIWDNTSVAATVSFALFASASTATGVAMALPYLLNRLGRDPAFGSGPLATVIQDLLSILVYFAIAVALTG